MGKKFAWTDIATRVLVTAAKIAKKSRCASVEPMHVLSAILEMEESGGVGVLALKNLGGFSLLRARVRISLVSYSKSSIAEKKTKKLPFSPQCELVLKLAQNEAVIFHETYKTVRVVGSEHLVLACFYVSSTQKILRKNGIFVRELRKAILEILDLPKKKKRK